MCSNGSPVKGLAGAFSCKWILESGESFFTIAEFAEREDRSLLHDPRPAPDVPRTLYLEAILDGRQGPEMQKRADLRHSTASYLAMKGASLVEIADVLGHRTLQMVRRYAHLSDSHVKGLMESLNDDLFDAK